MIQIVSLLTVGTQALCLKLVSWRRFEVKYVEPQCLAGQGFACNLWMNATLHHIPGKENLDTTCKEEKGERGES